jgi:hypothetical protein
MSVEDYCELCDLPKSQCIHGQPPPPPAPAAKRTSSRPTVRRTASTPAPAAAARSVPRRWTPPDVFKAHILEVLHEAGGELEQDDVFLELEIRMEDRLTKADHETTPEGELRWRYAARRARQALVTEGLMTTGRPGIWALA